MDHIEQIKEIANQLDLQGLVKQADLLDKYLLVYAQNTPAVPAPTPDLSIPTEPTIENKDLGYLSRTTFLMLSELRDFYVRNLPEFRYFGEANLKILQAAFDQLTTMYQVLLRNTSKQYDQEALATYEQHLQNLQREVDRSKKMKLTPIKVKIDKFLLYNEFEIILKKIERHYDAGLKELQPVLKKARSVRDAFSNIIQQTSEEIAHADLIETN
jgi:hypothetical protein